MRARAARYFGAAKKAILSLKDYYQHKLPHLLTLDPKDGPDPTCPYPMQYASIMGHGTQTFRYVSQLDKDKLVFYCMEADTPICVKFVRAYSREAHLKCSSLGFAPALRGYEKMAGGWFMVVMDFVDGQYELLDVSASKASFFSEIREKLTTLHQAGFVHGDIRTTNIMVKTNGERGIILFDFDWAGVIGEVRYPMNVNTTEIRRPTGVRDNELILPHHDLTMIDFM